MSIISGTAVSGHKVKQDKDKNFIPHFMQPHIYKILNYLSLSNNKTGSDSLARLPETILKLFFTSGLMGTAL